jgi:nucleoside diphosphate kinase
MQKAVPLVEEITLALLKPDFIRRGGNESWIAKELSRHGLRIVAQKDLPNWSRRDGTTYFF